MKALLTDPEHLIKLKNGLERSALRTEDTTGRSVRRHRLFRMRIGRVAVRETPNLRGQLGRLLRTGTHALQQTFQQTDGSGIQVDFATLILDGDCCDRAAGHGA